MPGPTRPSATPSGGDPRLNFAAAVREARAARGWNQAQLAEAAGVSEPTIQRYETGKSGTPDAETARKVFKALGLDPRAIPVLLGYLTAEEMGLPAEQPRVFDPTTEEILAILEDPKVPAAFKAEVLRYAKFRTNEAGRAAG